MEFGTSKYIPMCKGWLVLSRGTKCFYTEMVQKHREVWKNFLLIIFSLIELHLSALHYVATFG